MKRLKIFIKFGALFFLVLIALVSWVITTESGLQWSWSYIEKYIPKELVVNDISGQLNGKISLKQLKWIDDTNNIEVSELNLECNLFGLIFSKLDCLKVDTLLISYSLKSNSNSDSHVKENDLTSNGTNINLPEISLPFSISVDILNIKEIRYLESDNSDNLEGNNKSLVHITKFTLENLYGISSKISFERLKAYHPASQSNINVAAEVNFKEQWSHQLTLLIDSPLFKGKLESKGKVDIESLKKPGLNIPDDQELAIFNITTLAPYHSEIGGQWYWENGLKIKQGFLKSGPQDIVIGEDKISLNKLSSQFNVSWPNFELDSQLNINWQVIKNIALKLKINSRDIANWQHESKVVVSVITELQSSVIQDLENRILNVDPALSKQLGIEQGIKKHSNSTPVSGIITLDINQGQMNLNGDNIKVADASLSLKAESNIEKGITDNLKFEGTLEARTLNGLLNYPVESVGANWAIQKNKHEWFVSSKGKVGTLKHPELRIEGLTWDVKLEQQWSGKISALSIVTSSLKQLDSDKLLAITSPNVKLNGNANNHSVDVQFSVANSKPTKIGITGKLVDNKAMASGSSNALHQNEEETHWHIKTMQASVPFAKRSYLINAINLKIGSGFQKIESLCIKESGKICLSGFRNENEWAAKIDSEEISLQSLSYFSEYLGIAVPFDFEGKFTGFAALSGTNEQLNEMRVNLLSPEVKLNNESSEINWKDLSLKSGKSNGHYSLTVNWLSIKSSYSTPIWQSELNSPSGLIELNVAPNWDLNFSLKQKNIRWAPPYSMSNDELFSFIIPEIQFGGHIESGILNSKLKLLLPEKDFINANFKSSWPLTADEGIEGEVELLISKLDWLKKWQARIDQLDASWQQKFVISGTMNEPSIIGTGLIKIANLEIEEIGIDIRDSQFALSLNNEKLELVGKLINKQGELNLVGDASLYPNLIASLKLTGQNLVLLNDKQNRVVITPNIMANLQNNELEIKGEIIIDEAKLKISALPKQAVTVSDDQIIVENQQKPQSAFKYNINLNMKTGELVYVSGFGLTSEVQGHLKTTAVSGEPIILNGRLSLVGGQFEAFKQKLTIEQGELLFLGTADNPGIQFRAVRKLDEIKVGVIANGSLASPRLTLYSQPAMSEENILALLLTGKTIESLSQKEGSALANAAISLGIEGANKLAQKIGAALGIKNLAVSSKIAADSTRVDIGAQINSKLTVGYGAIIDSKNEMSSGWIIEYQLSKSVSIEAISGETMNASISYKKQIAAEPGNKKKEEKQKKLDE